ncbi:hypothetical protein MPUL_35680 [Mycolicibacterium pulveris]|uniref:PE-PGRS family protein n=1 Tax=Mycolicibacterium pulveris TaxID=36813 RepID=A0A7I7UN32_MYCPV|nr:hypothetical protein MPUL_35680 [Mycolicibacterium pulveris]
MWLTIVCPPVALMANPLEAYELLFTNTAANLQSLLEDFVEPGLLPIPLRILQNQIENLQDAGTALADYLDPNDPFGFPAQLQTAIGELQNAEVQDAFETLSSAFAGFLFPVLPLFLNPILNLVAVVDTLPTMIALSALPLIGVPFALFQGTGQAIQGVIDAAQANDPAGVLGALVAGPAVIANAVINGYDPTFTPGLLGNLGLLTVPVTIRDTILGAIGGPPDFDFPLAAPAVQEEDPAPLTQSAGSEDQETGDVEEVAAQEGAAGDSGSDDVSALSVDQAEDLDSEEPAEDATDGTTTDIRESLKAVPGGGISGTPEDADSTDKVTFGDVANRVLAEVGAAGNASSADTGNADTDTENAGDDGGSGSGASE